MTTLQDLVPQEVWAQLPDAWFFTSKKHTLADLLTTSQPPYFMSRAGILSIGFVENVTQAFDAARTVVSCLADTAPAELSHFSQYLRAARCHSATADARLAALTTIAQAPSTLSLQDLLDTVEEFGPQSSMPATSLYGRMWQLLLPEVSTSDKPTTVVNIPPSFWPQVMKHMGYCDWKTVAYPVFFEGDSPADLAAVYAELFWERPLVPAVVSSIRELSNAQLRQLFDVLLVMWPSITAEEALGQAVAVVTAT